MFKMKKTRGTYDGTNGRAEERCGGEDGHSESTLFSGEEIRDGSTEKNEKFDGELSSSPNRLQTWYTNPAFVNGLDPAVPARKRSMMSVQMFCEAMTAPLKIVNKI